MKTQSYIPQRVIIIGAGITGLTLAFLLKTRGIPVLILEKCNRVGGRIHTLRENGFIFEAGPNSGIMAHPEVAQLFESLGKEIRPEIAKSQAKKRLIWKKNAFYPLPASLKEAIITPLFTWSDKIRILGEPFRKKGSNPNESVASITSRRLGKSFLDYAVDPFIGGIYAGNPEKLITRFALPKLYALEQTSGSFIRGAISGIKKRRKMHSQKATKEIFSVSGGLSTLTDRLYDILKSDIVLETANLSIIQNGALWKLDFCTAKAKHTLLADSVVSTVGAHILPDILPFLKENEKQLLQQLIYAPVIQVAIGISGIHQCRYNAFGGLVPSVEKEKILGILYPSACFDNRSPKGSCLFSFFLGGLRNPDIYDLPDREIKELAVKACSEMLKIKADARIDLLRIFRYKNAIPQYTSIVGPVWEWISTFEKQHQGLYLAGNIRNGIGLADRIRQAYLIADQIKNDNNTGAH